MKWSKDVCWIIQSTESKDEAEKERKVPQLRNRVLVPPKSLAKVL